LFDDSGPPSDREREDQWRQTLFAELREHGKKLGRIEATLYLLVMLLAGVLVRAAFA
jgi:hypothetical protein